MEGKQEGQQQHHGLGAEIEEMGRNLASSFRAAAASITRSFSSARDDDREENEEEMELKWAAIQRLPTYDRMRTSLFDQYDDQEEGTIKEKRAVDVTRLGPLERRVFIESLIKHIQNDNLRLLQKQKERIDRVGVKQPTIEVRYKKVFVEAECEVVQGKPLPTLWNAAISNVAGILRLTGLKRPEAKIQILKDISGIIKPSRLTLLLGPPGCGKTTLLKALAGRLDNNLKVSGEIEYNGMNLKEFVPEKTSVYIGQYDLHIPEITVRETLDYSARFQGVGSRAEIIREVIQREKEAGITPDHDIDTYMKAISAKGLEGSLQTDYILKIMGLDICADIMVGDAMRRGISGGEKKRLTTGEMIVGPSKALFMDEISTGLDSSTTYQIISCLQQLAHISESTVLVSLLQPSPETYELFDDVILMAEGKIVYHGPRSHILDFFEECGFKCPERKGAADFLQEVISKKDQGQYWNNSHGNYTYHTVDQLRNKFKASRFSKDFEMELSKPFDKSRNEREALSFSRYSLSKLELLKACMDREFLLMKRNAVIYITKTVQLSVLAIIAGTVFYRTQMAVDISHSSYYMGAIFYAILLLMVNGFPELALAVARLPGFYKQRDYYFYPAWAYAIPSVLSKLPISLLESFVWTSITYYLIGYSPEASRFFRHLLILFSLHVVAYSLFRCIASFCQNMVASSVAGTLSFLTMLLLGGFLIPHTSMPDWLKWAFWISPVTYAEISLTGNEFLAPRWQDSFKGTGTTVGRFVLKSRGLDYDDYFYWISFGALVGFIILFNILYAVGLTIRKSPGSSRAIISREKLSSLHGEDSKTEAQSTKDTAKLPGTSIIENEDTRKMALPFVPLAISFHNVNYFVETPKEMRKHGYTEKRLQLLNNITGAFRPGVLSALMGVTGAGKTTLLDVLAGRKTGGFIEGDIRVGGYPKVQATFARVSGYCEQTDIHSPQITVEESVAFSAWLRLPPEINLKTRKDFVNEVLETIELDEIKDALVGIPGVSGLSTEQRKRLTIAVELVSNPSVIFMDEPTSGLDARAAAIVMRAVKNVAKTGRTVLCTIHQPSIEIFEAFDELMLMKRGGQLIYAGPLGYQSSKVIEYFEGINGVTKIQPNYNPSTWMMEVTSISIEAQLGIDFAEIYIKSRVHEENLTLVKSLSIPPEGSADLSFSSMYPQKGWEQFKACIWKLSLSYWRSPAYNLVRLAFILAASVALGLLYWQHGNDINDQQGLFTILGGMYGMSVIVGINNAQSVMPFVSIERTVVYRENFAGMYSPWAYASAQVAIEVPYVFIQVLIFMLIAYPAIGFSWTAPKFFWFFYTFFCTILYFVYLSILLVSITPNIQIASIFASMFYTIQNLFSGFLIPSPQIPKWWIWLYYASPLPWTLNGLFTSQYGDRDEQIQVFGQLKPISNFLGDYFGFYQHLLPLVGVVLLAFPVLFAILFARSIAKLNFQRR